MTDLETVLLDALENLMNGEGVPDLPETVIEQIQQAIDLAKKKQL